MVTLLFCNYLFIQQMNVKNEKKQNKKKQIEGKI